VAGYQNANGFYHQLLNDPSSYEELSGTAIFTMAIAKGVNKGWLDAKKFRPIAEKGWKAISTQIETDGTVHRICIGTMSSEDPEYYKNRPLVDDDSHGLLGLVFCAIEVDKMLKK
jgi:rhamnogalacturonyl hydrolase YesR